MKSLSKSIRSNGLLLALASFVALSFNAQAKDWARVHSIKGKAFVLHGQKSWELKKGSTIPDFAEVITEVGAQLALSDYHDHKFFVSGQSQIKVLNRIVELKRGYLWVQSTNETETFSVQTANSLTDYKKAEAIVSFDSVSGKSQVLCVSGRLVFSNILEAHLKMDLTPGQFSFVDSEYENGVPRRPTPIGYASYQKVLSLFPGVLPLEKNESLAPKTLAHTEEKTKTAPSRGIASLSDLEKSPEQRETQVTASPVEQAKEIERPGQLVIIKRDQSFVRLPASVDVDKLYQEKMLGLKKRKLMRDPRDYSRKSGVPVRIFGQGHVSEPMTTYAPTTIQRAPASVSAEPVTPTQSQKINIMDPRNYREPAETARPQVDPFEKSLLKEYKSQMRHTQEVNSLIEELQNYKDDFNKNY